MSNLRPRLNHIPGTSSISLHPRIRSEVKKETSITQNLWAADNAGIEVVEKEWNDMRSFH